MKGLTRLVAALGAVRLVACAEEQAASPARPMGRRLRCATRRATGRA
jgi:hypothetical protein